MSQTDFVINLDFAVRTDRLFATIAGAPRRVVDRYVRGERSHWRTIPV